MKKITFCAAHSLFRIAFFSAISLFLLTGCPDEPEGDYSSSEITIYNIPQNIPVFGNDSASAPAFKIYLNASNTMSEDDPPAAKGVAKFSNGTLTDGKYTITIRLQNPNSPEQEDPNADTGPWSGTANYFSVMISPEDVTEHGANAVWVRAGTTLNKGKESCDWNSLINFRGVMANDPDDEAEYAKKTNALYNSIVCKDKDIKSSAEETVMTFANDPANPAKEFTIDSDFNFKVTFVNPDETATALQIQQGDIITGTITETDDAAWNSNLSGVASQMASTNDTINPALSTGLQVLITLEYTKNAEGEITAVKVNFPGSGGVSPTARLLMAGTYYIKK
jgi:hypothetical protein